MFTRITYTMIPACSSPFGAMQFSISTSILLRSGGSPDTRIRTTKTEMRAYAQQLHARVRKF